MDSSDDKYINGVVNIGNDIETPIIDLAKMIKEVTETSSEIANGPAWKEGDMTRRKPDIEKMKQLWSSGLLPLKEGIVKVIEHGKFN